MCVFSIVSFCSFIENLFAVKYCTRLESTEKWSCKWNRGGSMGSRGVGGTIEKNGVK
jgi:hypothetical protein